MLTAYKVTSKGLAIGSRNGLSLNFDAATSTFQRGGVSGAEVYAKVWPRTNLFQSNFIYTVNSL